MLDDLLKSAKETLLERLSSPILGSFGLAWLCWNYKFVVILLSANRVTTTFDLIDRIAFPDAWALASRGLLYPLLTASVYLFLYPHPARWVYGYLRRQQVAQNKTRQAIDNEAPLTREESRAVYAEVERQRQEADRLLNHANEQIRQLREANNRVEAQLRAARSESEPSLEVKAEAERTISDVKSKLADAIATRDRQAELFARIAKKESSVKVLVQEYLVPEQRNLILKLDQSGGIVNAAALRTDLASGTDDFRRHVKALEQIAMVEYVHKSSSSGEDRVRLLELGRTAVQLMSAQREIEAEPDSKRAASEESAPSVLSR